MGAVSDGAIQCNLDGERAGRRRTLYGKRPKTVARPAYQLAIAARVTKYGIKWEDAIWRVPLAVINQLLIFDDLQAGRRCRWKSDSDKAAQTLAQYIEDALTLVV